MNKKGDLPIQYIIVFIILILLLLWMIFFQMGLYDKMKAIAAGILEVFSKLF